MREVLVVSGKGGTGKTSLTAAFAHLAKSALICDLDVDAPDLHLLLQPETQYSHDFFSGHEARIDADQCDDCGVCVQRCAFQAVSRKSGIHCIDPLKCEGCRVCVHFCPADAIDFTPRHCGTWSCSKTRFGTMLHAQLFPGQENSGRLVALLRQQAKTIARERNQEALILSDGPPGIGCPVISALSGVDLAVVVTEPTPSGLHDLERIVSLCDYFQVPVALIINKYDLNHEMTANIRAMGRDRNAQEVGTIAHDPAFVHAMVNEMAITEYTKDGVAVAVQTAWHRIVEMADALSKAKTPAAGHVAAGMTQ